MSCSHKWTATAYYVAFGPHGPRTPINPPGTAVKVSSAVAGLVVVAAAIVVTLRHYGASSLWFHRQLKFQTLTNASHPLNLR